MFKNAQTLTLFTLALLLTFLPSIICEAAFNQVPTIRSPKEGQVFTGDVLLQGGGSEEPNGWPSVEKVPYPVDIEIQIMVNKWPGVSAGPHTVQNPWEYFMGQPWPTCSVDSFLAGSNNAHSNFVKQGTTSSQFRMRARFHVDGAQWGHWVNFTVSSLGMDSTKPQILSPTANYFQAEGMLKLAIQPQQANLPPMNQLRANIEWAWHGSETTWYQLNGASILPNSIMGLSHPNGFSENIPKKLLYPGFWQVRAQLQSDGASITEWSDWRPFQVKGALVPVLLVPTPGQIFPGDITLRFEHQTMPPAYVHVDFQYYDNGNWRDINTTSLPSQITVQEGADFVTIPGSAFGNKAGRWRVNAQYQFFHINGANKEKVSNWTEFTIGNPQPAGISPIKGSPLRK